MSWLRFRWWAILFCGLCFRLAPVQGASTTNPPVQIFTLKPLTTNAPLLAELPARLFAGSAHWAIETHRANGQLGFGVAAGSFSGRSRPELALAQPGYRSALRSGRILAFSFPKALDVPGLNWVFSNSQAGVNLRGDFAAGDVNGDGMTDLLVGMTDFTTNNAWHRQGLAWVLAGSTNGLAKPQFKQYMGTNLEALGRQVLLADVNRDGRADLLSASSNVDGGTNGVGGVRLVLGADSEAGFTNVWSVRGEQDNQYLGSALAVADLNGDGWPDLILGATGEMQNGKRVGSVRWFAGSSNGFLTTPAQVLYGTVPEAEFGFSVVSLEDVNGDGCAELVVGAPGSLALTNWPGEVRLFQGSPTGLVSRAVWFARGVKEQSAFGYAVAAVGDVNGDGRMDLLVGAPGSLGGKFFKPGQASLWLGRKEGFALAPDWSVVADGFGTLLGCRLGGAGDLDGDGLDDFFVASPYQSAGTAPRAGRVDVFRGLLSGYGAGEKFPADGVVCVPGNRSKWELDQIRHRELVSRAETTQAALAAATNAQQQANQAGHLKAEAEQTVRETKSQLVATHRQARRRLWWGGGISAVLAGAAISLWINRRRVRQDAVHRERERLARDLHDGFGSSVHRLQRLTELLNQVESGSPDAQRYRDELLLTAQELGGSMDRTIWAVQSENDTLENLVSYLASYAPSVLQANGIACELDFPATLPARALQGETRQHLFLAVNEVLNNVVKHSRARHAWLRMKWSEPWLEIVVEDDGCGRPSSEPRHRDAGGTLRAGGGNGLKNLRARLQAMQGGANWSSRPGGGTRVVLRALLPA